MKISYVSIVWIGFLHQLSTTLIYSLKGVTFGVHEKIVFFSELNKGSMEVSCHVTEYANKDAIYT